MSAIPSDVEFGWRHSAEAADPTVLSVNEIDTDEILARVELGRDATIFQVERALGITRSPEEVEKMLGVRRHRVSGAAIYPPGYVENLAKYIESLEWKN